MPRLTLLHSLSGTFENEDDMATKVRRGFDFNHSVFCQKEDAPRLKSFLNLTAQTGADDELERRNDSANRVSVRVHSAHPGLIVLNEWFTQAWKAKVMALLRTSVRANWWQVGVPVKEGDNFVEFVYRPSLCWGLLILNRITWSLLALLLVGRWLYPVHQPWRGTQVGLTTK